MKCLYRYDKVCVTIHMKRCNIFNSTSVNNNGYFNPYLVIRISIPPAWDSADFFSCYVMITSSNNLF